MKTSGRKLLRYLRPYRLRFIWALAQVFLIAGFELLKPWPLQIVLDDVLGGKSLSGGLGGETLLMAAAVGLVVIHAVSGGLTLLHNYTSIGIGQRMVNDLRGALYGHLQRLSLAFHSRQRVGDLMYRVTADSFAVQTMIMNGLLPILSAAVLFLGMVAVLAPIDPTLTLLALTVVPALFLVIGGFNARITHAAGEVRDADAQVYSLVQWALGSVKVVQAFTKEDEEYQRFMGASRASLRATLKLYSWQTLYSGVVNTIVAAGTALVVYAGARSVMEGRLTIGTLMVFIAYLGQLYGPVNQISQSWGLVAGARIGARRVFEILDTEADLKDGPDEIPPGSVKGAIEWRGVAFRYRPDLPVLHRVDLKIEAGTKVAVVGPTGAGKSTLLSLLPRFFDPTEGQVLLDGTDVRQYRLKSLRGQFAMVLQPPLIFPISVHDNIAYGRPDADAQAVERVARQARIHDLIQSLPHGYGTVIGEGGANLSEGEKQRLTIARALLRDAPILILDEPTSALDVETEALVMEAITALSAGRTSFIIAHRLSTVRNADLILVLRDGGIAEAGSFAELISRDGPFAALYRTQMIGLAEERTIG